MSAEYISIEKEFFEVVNYRNLILQDNYVAIILKLALHMYKCMYQEIHPTHFKETLDEAMSFPINIELEDSDIQDLASRFKNAHRYSEETPPASDFTKKDLNFLVTQLKNNRKNYQKSVDILETKIQKYCLESKESENSTLENRKIKYFTLRLQRMRRDAQGFTLL